LEVLVHGRLDHVLVRSFCPCHDKFLSKTFHDPLVGRTIAAEGTVVVFHTANHGAVSLPYPKDGDYYRLNFDTLGSFPADKPAFSSPRRDPRIPAKPPAVIIPSKIQALDGQKVSLTGFMIPMATDKDKVRYFILAQTRGSCCFGLVPQLNQWAYVTMADGRTIDPVMDIPVTVFGILNINSPNQQQDNGWCLYRMTSDKVDLPKTSWF
jgi:hypothetical protein